MSEPNKSEVLDLIQATLEKLKDSGDDVLFMSSDKNRGVLSGSYEGLSSLIAMNMVAYPQFKIIVDLAITLYRTKYKEIKELVDKDKPSHEIVDNYGADIESIINSLIDPSQEN